MTGISDEPFLGTNFFGEFLKVFQIFLKAPVSDNNDRVPFLAIKQVV